MSQPWIKLETCTPDKIEIARISTALGMDRYAVLGRLIRIWTYWDQHSTNGRIDGIDTAFLDSLVGFPGFSAQLVFVKWMSVSEDGAYLPNFARHNGATAKKRALTAKRNELYRGKRMRHESDAPRDADASHSASPEKIREEEIREEHTDVCVGLEHLLAKEWIEHIMGRSPDSMEKASEVFRILLDFGIPAQTILDEISRGAPHRDPAEHLWEFKKRLMERAGLNGKPGKLNEEEQAQKDQEQIKKNREERGTKP